MTDFERITQLFNIIKFNCNAFGGDKELYNSAFRAYTAIKFNNVEMARRYGFEFAKNFCNPELFGQPEYADITGTIKEFGALVEHSHYNMEMTAH